MVEILHCVQNDKLSVIIKEKWYYPEFFRPSYLFQAEMGEAVGVSPICRLSKIYCFNDRTLRARVMPSEEFGGRRQSLPLWRLLREEVENEAEAEMESL